MLNREQEISAAKLSTVQYVIMAVLLILVAGLWRLQVVGKDNYRALAEANRSSPRAGACSTAKAASSSTTIPPFPATSSMKMAAISTRICRSLHTAST
jgi:hypothetical protein